MSQAPGSMRDEGHLLWNGAWASERAAAAPAAAQPSCRWVAAPLAVPASGQRQQLQRRQLKQPEAEGATARPGRHAAAAAGERATRVQGGDRGGRHGHALRKTSRRPGGSFVTESAGGYHALGLRQNGAVECWGCNNFGQARPEGRADGPFIAVSAGLFHSLALRKDGTVACWGLNNKGQAPPEGRTDGPFVAVSAGIVHSLALRKDGTIACWGDNSNGQAPPEGFSDGPYTMVNASGTYSLAIRKNGSVASWGGDTD